MRAGLLLLIFCCLSLPVQAQDSTATLRKGTALSQETTPLPMYRVNNEDIKRKRNYPMQPPLIPHHVRGYQIDMYANKCLFCHSRRQSENSQAPMISVTHYMNRDGNFLADVSPRRYFCLQCHVSQTEAAPLIDNTFKDIDELLKGQP